ncbi:MAG: VOC family protein, partial [Bacteroidetes bacterium]|nr:VOC family protein [Bacteroidota bacterium]
GMIGGRPITTYKLTTPISYKKREIFLLELPSPKPGSKYSEGYEHVEFVIDVPLAEFRDRYNYLSFDENGFHKEVNSDLRLKWDEYSVKFHEHDLEYVIRFLDI